MAPKRKRGGSSGASSSRNGARRKKRPAPSPSPTPSPSPSSSPSPPPRRHAPEVIDVDKETWDVRDPELDFFYPEEEYKEAPGMFSVAFHHGGSFFETKDEKKYVGGYLTFFDDCDINQFELIDLSSMVLKLRYDRKTICEFYYCDPKYSPGYVDRVIGGPLMPIVEDAHLIEFLKVAATSTKLVHIYVLEITRAAAILKKMKDEAQAVLKIWPPKSAGVIIEEIEEAEAQPTVLKRPPRRKRKQEQGMVNNKPLMIGWYDKDVEFDEYLVKSLEHVHAKWKRDDEIACQNLEKAFAEVLSEAVPSEAPVSDAIPEVSEVEVMPDVGESVPEAVEAIPQTVPDVVEPMADVGEVGGEDFHAHVQEVIEFVICILM